MHTTYVRDMGKILEVRIIGSEPFKNITERNFYDAAGRVVETDTYNEDGEVIKRLRAQFMVDRPDLIIGITRETGADGQENVRYVEEKTHLKTGTTRQIATMNGKPETDWTIQRMQSGQTSKDKILEGDGSYSERELLPDGTTREDGYSAKTDSHTHQKMDPQGHVVELPQGSDSSYVRCTYSFDKTGRPTGQINYDKSGTILSKSSIEYVDDGVENWIERKLLLWDTKLDPPQARVANVTLRVIVYY